MNARVVSCPQCGKPVAWDTTTRYRPFCSERCRLIDLGAWANENYRIRALAGLASCHTVTSKHIIDSIATGSVGPFYWAAKRFQ